MQEVSVRHLGNDAGLHARRPQCFKKSVVTPEFFVLAVPVAPQLVTFGRIHGGDEFERIERFAAGIYLLEDDANGFLRCSGSQGNHGHVVAFETLKYLPFEAPEFSPHWFVFRTTPVAVESVLPIIPIEDAGHGINQRFDSFSCVVRLRITSRPKLVVAFLSSGMAIIASSRSTAGSRAFRISM